MKRSIILATFAPLGVAFLTAPCALTSCSPKPAPQPPHDAAEVGPEPSADDVCAHLLSLSCAEGIDPSCAAKIGQVQRDRLTVWPLRCWYTAPDRAAARACGAIACPEPAP